LKLPLELAERLERPSSPFAQKRIRLMSRRRSLAESLARHAALLGLESSDADADVIVIDVGSQPDELKSMLIWPRPDLDKLVVIATAAEVEAHDLRVLLDETRIVLKPVHRIALREALAAALGVRVDGVADPLASSASSIRLCGHVLLVEDEPVNAAVAEGYLASLGCTSAWARTGADAVARFAGEGFDLVLMDLNMPDMDGFAATRLIRQREGKAGRVPIVALTAHEASNYREKCLAADMDDILSKPYTLDDCAHLLRKWLGSDAATARAAQATNTSLSQGHDGLLAIDAATIGSLRKLRGGTHADLYSKLVGLFATGSTDALAQLQTALAGNDMKAAGAICHKLASSAANVGALAYGRHVRRLEQACIAGDEATVSTLHVALSEAHAPLLDALQAMTLKASA
jgi:CheY-like chemotaxis protein